MNFLEWWEDSFGFSIGWSGIDDENNEWLTDSFRDSFFDHSCDWSSWDFHNDSWNSWGG